MNTQMASAVLEIRAVTKEPESLAGVFAMNRILLSEAKRMAGMNFIVRCMITHIADTGHKLVFALSVQPVGHQPEQELQTELKKAIDRFRRIAAAQNVGINVSHSTYDQYLLKGPNNVKERKAANAGAPNLSQYAQGIKAGSES